MFSISKYKLNFKNDIMDYKNGFKLIDLARQYGNKGGQFDLSSRSALKGAIKETKKEKKEYEEALKTKYKELDLERESENPDENKIKFLEESIKEYNREVRCYESQLPILKAIKAILAVTAVCLLFYYLF